MDVVGLMVKWLSPIVAIVYVLSYSSLFEPVRKWKRLPKILSDLLGCPMCIGFWAGALVGLLNNLNIAWPWWLESIVLGGCLGLTAEYLLELAWRT